MRHSPLRRAVGAWAVISAAALLFGSGVVGNTLASFSAETTNKASAFADGWLGAPGSPSVSVSGYDARLTWTPTATGPLGGHKIYGVDNGTSSSCTGAAYADLAAAGLTAASAAYTDANRGSGSANGDWYCYEVLSTGGAAVPNWSTPATLPAIQLGLVAKTVTVTGNNSGGINSGDKIAFTFNQPPASPGNVTVCAFKSPSVLLIGDTHAGGCNTASDTYSIAKLSTTASIGQSRSFTGSSAVVGSTLTITIGTGSAASVGTSASWSFALSTSPSVKSAATTDQATLCGTTAATCTPTFSVATAF
ncbi:MAG TPA: hypothetical protein VHC67_01160 [Gaiellaceae bacterium]|jgi:hypothetical protein|nr:hypothetical protein [Gaiellaceae bacterium]